MNHVQHKALFGKQESQESIQESRNQAKIPKMAESRWWKFRVADPLGLSLLYNMTLLAQPFQSICIELNPEVRAPEYITPENIYQSIYIQQHYCRD